MSKMVYEPQLLENFLGPLKQKLSLSGTRSKGEARLEKMLFLKYCKPKEVYENQRVRLLFKAVILHKQNQLNMKGEKMK